MGSTGDSARNLGSSAFFGGETSPDLPPDGLPHHGEIGGPLPERIGPFRIRRRIGAGGMGVVYEAVQEAPRRAVAVKVMRRGITSRAALRRFEYEAQVMARLRHPGIAQVFEAGTCEVDGEPTPYFAMEYVPNARTITTFATEHKLTVRDRLALFALVCEAVHHGHQRGIIHRDLKPANILVDPEGHPKVIDFGVARATDSDMAVTTQQTHVGQLIGTLQYMSPEQCDADPNDLDTRSDVYALGVILYELLTDQLPYDVTKAALHAATKVIKEEPPARPSSFRKALRGDAEVVVLKALEKERSRRFQSAGEMAADLRRLIADEPLAFAKAPSVGYQLRKLVRKHRKTVGMAAGALALLVAAAVVSTVYAVRAEIARAESGAVSRFFLDDVLAVVDPEKPGAIRQEWGPFLEHIAARADDELGGYPDVRARVDAKLGVLFAALSRDAEALHHLERAAGYFADDAPSDIAARSEFERYLARATARTGGPARREEAIAGYARALALAEQATGRGSLLAVLAQFEWGSALAWLGDEEGAMVKLEEAESAAAHLTDPRGRQLHASILTRIGRARLDAIPPDLAGAGSAFDRADAKLQTLDERDRSGLAVLRTNQCISSQYAQDWDAAARFADDAVRYAQHYYGASHKMVASALTERAQIRARSAAWEGAIADARDAVALLRGGSAGPDTPKHLANALSVAAMIHGSRARSLAGAEAEAAWAACAACMQESGDLLESAGAIDACCEVRLQHAVVLWNLQRPDQADAPLIEAERLLASLGASAPETLAQRAKKLRSAIDASAPAQTP